MMRRLSILLAVLALAAPLAGLENRIVLRVNGRIATLYDFETRLFERVESISAAPTLEPERRQKLLETAPVDVMQEIYEELLVLSRGDQLDINPTSEDIDRAEAQTRESFGIDSEELFVQALGANGMTREQFRDQLRDTLLIREVMSIEVHSRIHVVEEDLRRYYSANGDQFTVPLRLNVREVVVLEAASDEAEMARLAEEIRAALAEGADLEEVVAPLAEQELVSEVIDLGWVAEGHLDPELEAAIIDLAPGEFSPPVPGRGGLHIVEVVDREDPRRQTFAEARAEIARRERARHYQEHLEEYFEELEAGSHIVAKPPPDAAAFEVGSGSRPEEVPGLTTAIDGAVGEAPPEMDPDESPQPAAAPAVPDQPE